MRPKQALDMGVALAVKRLWSVEGKGDYLRSWAVGSAEAVAGHELDGRMTELLEGIAKAGSWATWMGVVQPGWMELLKAGGMQLKTVQGVRIRICRPKDLYSQIKTNISFLGFAQSFEWR